MMSLSEIRLPHRDCRIVLKLPNPTTGLLEHAYRGRYDRNRTSIQTGGDSAAANLRTATYTPNALNQYTAITRPGLLEIYGKAPITQAVTVNALATTRQGRDFRKELTFPNTSQRWESITTNGGSVSTSQHHLPAANTTPTYDLDGNQTGDGQWTYTWDAENRLTSATRSAAALAAGAPYRAITYRYDSKSRKITRSVATISGGPLTTEKYLYDGWNCIAEYSNSPLNTANFQLTTSRLWGLDLSTTLQGAGGVGGLLLITDHSALITTHYPCYDGNGNIRKLLNATTLATTANYDYGPFGDLIRATGPYAAANSYRFSTKPQDKDTGLLYYNYRHYDARTARWLGRDPIEESGGINLYGFIGNDGVNRVDFLGMRWIMKGTIDDDTRRIWSRSNPKTDTLEQLAAKVKLDPQESKKWAKQVNGNTCEYSVPNVFLVSDLLGYDKADDALITTFGGRLGNLFTQAPGKKKVSAKTVAEMESALSTHKGNLWGYAVYAHGGPSGSLHATRRGPEITNAKEIYDYLKANGFQLSKVWMMQCFGGANGRSAWWGDVSYRNPVYYIGINTCGIDLK